MATYYIREKRDQLKMKQMQYLITGARNGKQYVDFKGSDVIAESVFNPYARTNLQQNTQNNSVENRNFDLNQQSQSVGATSVMRQTSTPIQSLSRDFLPLQRSHPYAAAY